MATLKNFRSAYERLVRQAEDGKQRTFDMEAALAEAKALTGRQ